MPKFDVALERALKALANKRRLAILRVLIKSRSASVGTIATKIKLSFKSTSKHLAILCAADIVEKEQQNVYMLYQIAKHLPSVARHVVEELR